MAKHTPAGCDFVSLAAPGVPGLKPYEPGKPIEELEREYGIAGAVKLASNENPLGPGPLALAAIRAALGSLHRYPDGSGYALKKALAAHRRPGLLRGGAHHARSPHAGQWLERGPGAGRPDLRDPRR